MVAGNDEHSPLLDTGADEVTKGGTRSTLLLGTHALRIAGEKRKNEKRVTEGVGFIHHVTRLVICDSHSFFGEIHGGGASCNPGCRQMSLFFFLP